MKQRFTAITQVIWFYLRQVLLFGSLAFGMWLFQEWLKNSSIQDFVWPSEWVLTITLVGGQLIIVSTPLLMLMRKVRSLSAFYVAGFLSGPLGVVLFLWFFVREPFGIYNYLVWPQTMHIICASMSLGFAHNMHLFFSSPRPRRTLA